MSAPLNVGNGGVISTEGAPRGSGIVRMRKEEEELRIKTWMGRRILRGWSEASRRNRGVEDDKVSKRSSRDV
jgi:hypothetical protein